MGSMWLRHEGISIQVEWPGGAMELDRFTRTLKAIEATWESVSGTVARTVPASALTYEAGEPQEARA